jgi:hypothetical protein
MYGDVLSTNQTMLAFCRKLGFVASHLPGDATVTRVMLTL